MKFGVVVFPGSNCDRDMHDALAQDLGQEVEMLWHKDSSLKGLGKDDCIVLPGGFSYGDYLRCGAMAQFSPIMESVVEHAKNGGKLLGVCNGFQILCETGLLPGALLTNDHQKFVCKNVFIKSENNAAPINAAIGSNPLKIPIAHGEGRFYADEKTLASIHKNEQVIFKYCDQNGNVSSKENPNGSLDNIAGICNEERNVFGMMPHPERACSTILGNTDGQSIFNSLINN